MRRLSPKPAAAAILIVAAMPCLAQEAPAPQPSSDVARLSPEDREAALEAGAAQAARELPINGLSRGVHGEMGIEVGSRGERALYGSAAVPLGDTGSAQFSFFTGNSGRWRVR